MRTTAITCDLASVGKVAGIDGDFLRDLQQIDTLGNDLATRLAGTTDPGHVQQMKSQQIIGERTATGLVLCFLLAKDDDNSSSGRMLAMARALGDKQEEATILQNIAYKLMWGDDDDVKQAVAYYEKALRLLRKIGDKHGAVDLLSRIGFLLRNLGDNAKTLDHFEQALPLLREVGDKSGEAINLKRIGTAWDRMGDKQKALDLF
ncbi:MAG: tetratricopeptide repeat protein [Chloroflexi bacterium]|uniref:tetratricopeptide repeat protein n=1 Tax=Candidatus Flexifilum breve TaxID=3140694 RepID=UPI003134817D|nr:tetratricopeptide repeat protein [Chloroflexota bacterium]